MDKEHLETGVWGEGGCKPGICGRRGEDDERDDGKNTVYFVYEGRRWQDDKIRE
jgi:hypothetical protein